MQDYLLRLCTLKPIPKREADKNCQPLSSITIRVGWVLTQSIAGIGRGPWPMQLVVVRAVRKAVSAATITFAATSMMRFLSMVSDFDYQFSSLISSPAPLSSPLPPWLLPAPEPPCGVGSGVSLPSCSGSSTLPGSLLVTRLTSLPLRS